MARLRMPAGMGIGPHPLVARAEADLERAEFEAAAEAFEPAASRLSAHDPARARAAQLALEARCDLARAHLFAHRFVAARRELARVLSRDPGRVDARWLRARLWERAGRQHEALEELEALERAGVRSPAAGPRGRAGAGGGGALLPRAARAGAGARTPGARRAAGRGIHGRVGLDRPRATPRPRQRARDRGAGARAIAGSERA